MSPRSSRSSSSSLSSTPGSGYNTDDTEVSSRGNPESRRGSYGPTLDKPCPLKRNTYCSEPLASLTYFSTQNHLDVSKNEKSLFKIRREADLWKTVYKFKKNVLGSQALSALNGRWEDLKNTALQIEASLGTEAEGSCIEMKTVPLLLSSYVQDQDEEISQIHTTFSKLVSYLLTEPKVYWRNTELVRGTSEVPKWKIDTRNEETEKAISKFSRVGRGYQGIRFPSFPPRGVRSASPRVCGYRDP